MAIHTGAQDKIVAFLSSGKPRTRESIAKAAGIDAGAVTSTLAHMRKSGKIAYEKPGGGRSHPVDFDSIRVLGDEERPKRAPRRARVSRVEVRPVGTSGRSEPELDDEATAVLGKRLVGCDALVICITHLREVANNIESLLANATPIPIQLVEGLRAFTDAVDVRPAPRSVEPRAKTAEPAKRMPRPKTKSPVVTVADGVESFTRGFQGPFRVETATGRRLTELPQLETARKVFDGLDDAHRIIDITGAVVATKGAAA